MKTGYLYGLALVFLMACNSDDGKSDAYGNFETEETIVSSEIAGKLIGFNLELGQNVLQGDLLAMVDTAQLSLQIQQIKAQQRAVSSKKVNVSAQVEVIREQLENAQIIQKRIAAMFTEKASTQQQLDDVNGQVRVLEKQLKSSKTQFVTINEELKVLDAQLSIVRDQLNKCGIKSPLEGTVLEKYAERGELLMPGKAVVKLADLSELDLRIYVSGEQLPHVKLGQQVEVIIDENKIDNQSLNGVVSWISPEAEFTPKIIQTKKERVKLVYAVKVAVKNDGRLKIGMPAEINF